MAYIGGFLALWFNNKPNETAMQNMVRVGLHEAQEIAAQNTPVLTGDLREHWEISDAIRHRPTFLGMAYEGDWFNELSYAPYVNYGTGLYGPEHHKYLIVPKSPTGTLHWVDKLTGRDMFAKAVMHPGSPGHHMLEISAAWLEASWTKLMRPVLDAWAKEVEHQNPWATVT